ncbi:MAG TPA: type 2 isopentenyl-diphosphate Delta-isomerase [Phaeodactylibacter sp.]|nr:type 2 isopentenyl-diphosphate Delta-isomerase [Phaeodactylibacter sp.]
MSNRKKDHIELACKARVGAEGLDQRFYFEPLFAAHPQPEVYDEAFDFLGKRMRAPLWISSMTGGTEHAGRINRHLAKACRQFGLGMGLGSCRSLLDSDEHWDDFNLRPILGPDAPFFANLGIAQVEELLGKNEIEKLLLVCDRLQTDGLIVHINPLQEWMQPEGDRFNHPPLETLRALLEVFPRPLIVKEVGQGFGPESLKALLELPLAAIDFGAAGGTNFALLEMLRDAGEQEDFRPFTQIGHTAEEMLDWVRDLLAQPDVLPACRHLIISGGIKDFLHGYYLLERSPLPAVYAQASAFLKPAMESYEVLEKYVANQLRGLHLAKAMLKVK